MIGELGIVTMLILWPGASTPMMPQLPEYTSLAKCSKDRDLALLSQARLERSIGRPFMYVGPCTILTARQFRALNRALPSLNFVKQGPGPMEVVR